MNIKKNYFKACLIIDKLCKIQYELHKSKTSQDVQGFLLTIEELDSNDVISNYLSSELAFYLNKIQKEPKDIVLNGLIESVLEKIYDQIYKYLKSKSDEKPYRLTKLEIKESLSIVDFFGLINLILNKDLVNKNPDDYPQKGRFISSLEDISGHIERNRFIFVSLIKVINSNISEEEKIKYLIILEKAWDLLVCNNGENQKYSREYLDKESNIHEINLDKFHELIALYEDLGAFTPTEKELINIKKMESSLTTNQIKKLDELKWFIYDNITKDLQDENLIKSIKDKMKDPSSNIGISLELALRYKDKIIPEAWQSWNNEIKKMIAKNIYPAEENSFDSLRKIRAKKGFKKVIL